MAARTNSAGGAAVVNEKAPSNTAQAGGWGSIGACRNKATSNTGCGSSTFDSRPNSCHGTAPTWGKHRNAHNFDGGWKKSNGPWDKEKNLTRKPTSSWSNPYVKNQMDSCGRGKDDIRGESTWDIAESFGKGLHEDTFGNAATSFGNKGQSNSWNKPQAFGTNGNPSLNKQAEGSSWNKEDRNQHGSWERPKTFEGGRSSGGRGGSRGGRDQFGRGRGGGLGGRGQFGRGRGEGRGGRDQFGRGRGSGRGGTNQFGRGRPCDQGQSSGQGFGGWKKGRTDDNADQHGYLEKPKAFEGGRGSGGRMGRGANRGGRSTQNNGTNARMSMANHTSSWGKFQGFDGSKNAAGISGDQKQSTSPRGNTPKDYNAGKKDDAEASGNKRAAQVRGDRTDSWGNNKKDGKVATNWNYSWSRQ